MSIKKYFRQEKPEPKEEPRKGRGTQVTLFKIDVYLTGEDEPISFRVSEDNWGFTSFDQRVREWGKDGFFDCYETRSMFFGYRGGGKGVYYPPHRISRIETTPLFKWWSNEAPPPEVRRIQEEEYEINKELFGDEVW